jgi:hypothetical protein
MLEQSAENQVKSLRLLKFRGVCHAILGRILSGENPGNEIQAQGRA